MTIPPWLVFLSLITLTLALAYQVFSRRFGWRVLGYWVLIFIAAAGAEAAAEAFGFNATRFGDLRLAPDLAGAVVALFVLWFLGI